MDQLTPPDRVEFFVSVSPRGKDRPRASVVFKPGRRLGVHMRNTPATAEFEREIGHAAAVFMEGRPPMAGALSLTLFAAMPVPPSWSKAKQARALAGDERPTARPDASNILKAVEDALNGIVYADDAQLVAVSAVKAFGASPGLHVVVEPVKKGGR